MNKQKLIEKIEALPAEDYKYRPYVDKKVVLGLVRQLDEPKKVIIPQFVAEHIKHAKEIGRDLQDAMNSSSIHEEVDEWLYTDNNMELFARSWLDGYEMEEEPKYTVKFKATNQYLCDDYGIGLHISPSFRSNFRKSDLEKLSLTEVFDSTLFEVEEVTE